MIQNKEILFPILGFFAILIFSFILRKIYFKNENTLIEDPSPYLQQHKNNPVHWQTWNKGL